MKNRRFNGAKKVEARRCPLRAEKSGQRIKPRREKPALVTNRDCAQHGGAVVPVSTPRLFQNMGTTFYVRVIFLLKKAEACMK